MSRTSDVAIVVLNWRNAEDTIECLKSLSASEHPVDAIVVDNNSQDDSAARIERAGLAVTVVHNATNDGFAGGNNVGLELALKAGYDYIAVLNNDTLVEPGAIGRLLEVLRSTDGSSAVSPRIVYADRPDVDWFAGGTVSRGLPRHLTQAEVLTRTGVVSSETLTGCCIFATAETWRKVGLFDTRYFLIFEDSDWSARARQKDVTLLVSHDSVVQHKVSRSFVGAPMSLLSTYFYVRNGLLYHATHQRKHLPRFAMVHIGRTFARTALGRGVPPATAWFTGLAAWHFVRHAYGNAPPDVWERAFTVRRRGHDRPEDSQQNKQSRTQI